MKNELYAKINNYEMWYELFKESLLGMNIGRDGDIDQTGELYLIDNLKKESAIPDRGVIFDVGANIGKYSIALSNTFPFATIHAFEPAKHTFIRLNNNVSKYKNIIINNIGLDMKKGETDLYYDMEDSGLASVYKRKLDYIGIKFNNQEIIKLDTIDHYCTENSINSIDFLKIDTEGNEFNVLTGATEMIQHDAVKRIQIEFGGCNIDSRIFFRDFWDMLHEKYRFYRVLRDGLWEISSYTERLEVFSMTTYYIELK